MEGFQDRADGVVQGDGAAVRAAHRAIGGGERAEEPVHFGAVQAGVDLDSRAAGDRGADATAQIVERGAAQFCFADFQDFEQDFFEKVTADRYVISGDGKHGNPSIAALQWLSAARSGEKYEAYLTNRKLKENLTKPLDEFLKAEAKAAPEHRYLFRDEKALSISVEA